MSRRARVTVEAPAEFPAHNLEAERAVLGAAMAQDADAPAVIGELQQRGVVAETFFGEAHRILYRRLCALADAGRPTTLPTVLTALRESEELESVGGEVVIRLIAAEGTVTSQVPRHVDEILRLALKRETEAACLRLAEHARNGSGPADLIAEVNALATRIEHGIVREPSPIVERRPDDVQVKFVSAAVVFTFAALHHGREGLHATCAVTLRGRPIGPPSRVNLLGPKTRPDYARELSRIAPGPAWGALLDAACLALAAIAHEGGEVEAIIPAPLPAATCSCSSRSSSSAS